MRYCFSFAILVLSIVDPAIGADRVAQSGPTLEPQSPTTPLLAGYENRYWIVSSRNCPQQMDRVGCCALSSWRVDCTSCATETCQSIAQTRAVPSPVGADELRASLIPGLPVCVFVHGSYSRWDDVMVESKHTYHWLQNAAPEGSIQFIAFTWPSDPMTYLPHIDVSVLGTRSGINGFYLAQMMKMIPPECPVCFVAHSHGTRVVSSMLHLFQGGTVEGYCLPAGADSGHRIRAVFAASAIDHDWLNPGQRYGNAVSRLDSLLNLRNRRDWILGLYPLRKIGSSRSLGRAGWTSKDYVRLGMQSHQLQELDVTPLIGKPHLWPTYYDSPTVGAAISPFCQFSDGLGLQSESVSARSSSNAPQYKFQDSRADLVLAR